MPTNEVPTTEQPRWLELADEFLGQQPVAGRDASWVRDFAAWVHNTHGPFTLFDHMQSLHEKDIRAQKALKRMDDLGYEFNTETEQWVKAEVGSINTLYADHQRTYNERMRELMNNMMSPDIRGLELRIDPMTTVTGLSVLAARHPLTTAGDITRLDIDAPVRADIGTTGYTSPRTAPPAPRSAMDVLRQQLSDNIRASWARPDAAQEPVRNRQIYTSINPPTADTWPNTIGPTWLRHELDHLDRWARGRRLSRQDVETYLRGSTLAPAERARVIAAWMARNGIEAGRNEGVRVPQTYNTTPPPAPAPEPNQPITERTSEDRCYNALMQMRLAFRGLSPSRDALSDWLSYNRTLTDEEQTLVLDNW